MKQKMKEMEVMSEVERHHVMVEWNDTARQYEAGRCIHELFERRAEATPDCVAVIAGGEQVTYGELNRRANRLGNYLIAGGVEAEARVGICVERTAEMVVGMLGILKAGGAYLPLDPAYPRERLAFMLEDAKPVIVLTQEHISGVLPEQMACKTVCLDRDWPLISSFEAGNPAKAAKPNNLAYVIYTSGSTGVPKGVAIEHHSAVTMICWALEAFTPEELSGVLASTSICFDLSVFEIMVPLSCGGKIILVRNALELRGLEPATQVSLINTVPSAMAELMRQRAVPETVKVVNLAGEALKRNLVDRVYEQETIETVNNLYGPSEDTTYSTAAKVPRGSEPTIGRPISNTRVYVADERGEAAGIGIEGELLIAGEGLARGYLNRPDQTAERFVADWLGPEAGGRAYRTGDVVRYRWDGEIEFIGRVDQQVKVRGYRIELGEVEAALTRQEGVREAVVVVRGDDGDKKLVAYLVEERGGKLKQAEVRDRLRRRLPEYMVPSAIVVMESLPLTPNGKVDRKALPAPEQSRAELEAAYRAASTPTEEILTGIWVEVLGVEEVGVDDNFLELGGHSLLATQVMSRVREALHVELALRKVFEHPTVASLSREIEAERSSGQAAFDATPRIERVSRDKEPPLSFAQQRLWFLDRMEPGLSIYNIPVAAKLTGKLNLSAFEQSINELKRRHEVLRTKFCETGGNAVQIIELVREEKVRLLDVSGLGEGAGREARAIVRRESERAFDLNTGKLIRATVVKTGENEHVVMIVMHHIVSDGWSMDVMAEEIRALNGAYLSGQPATLRELDIQYADFAVWQREWLQGEALQRQLCYWRQQLEAIPVLELPLDHARPARQTFSGARESLAVSLELTQQLKRVARQEQATLFMLLLGAMNVLLWRLSGQQDIAVGTPIANRNRREVEGLIGFFVNTLVMRNTVRGDQSFRELLKEVREVTLGGYEHQDVPFERVVEEVSGSRSLNLTPVFQVMFTLQNGPVAGLEIEGVEGTPCESESNTSQFDLIMEASEVEGALIAAIEYNTDLFDAVTIKRMARVYERVLEEVGKDVERRVNEIEVMSEVERHQVMVEWNDTAGQYGPGRCIHELFERRAEATPDCVALVAAGEQVTYGELNRRANMLGHYLIAGGVEAEAKVGICVERTVEMVVGMLGILKAGAAYLPLDPAYPAERLRLILEDSQAALVLTQSNLADRLCTGVTRSLCLDSCRELIDQYSSDNPSVRISADNLAYVIYTSGSTGLPKGVELQHAGLINLISWHQQSFGITAQDRATQLAGVAFDASVWEIWPYLTAGASIHLPDEETRISPRMLTEWLAGNSITVCFLATPLAEAMMQEEWPEPHALRLMLTGGDRLHMRPRQPRRYELVNNYGPTEITIVATSTPVGEAGDETGPPTIGRPISNTRVYVADELGEVAGIGIEGELLIAGAGLARGYLNRPDQTAERFVADWLGPEAGGRAYRTGDVVRYRWDGEIEFIGRVDQQVKVRGYRIELGEVEAALMRQEGVREAVVMARGDGGGDKRLVAYIEEEEGKSVEIAEVRESLRVKLPDYMQPAAYVKLDRLPLTPNGKVDRQRLPAPESAAQSEEVVEAKTATEELLVRIWGELLKREDVSTSANFFEIGGHSLLATQLMSRVRETFNVEMAVRSLFDAPTISSFAARVDRAMGKGEFFQAPAIRPAARSGRAPLSFSQHSLWFIEQLSPGNFAYNSPVAVRLDGNLNIAGFEHALDEVVRRHDVLRTSIAVDDGEPVQLIASHMSAPLSLVELNGLPAREREDVIGRLTVQEARRPFDFSGGPLLRVTLLLLGEAQHLLLLTIHHVLTDGWSFGVFFDELTEIYADFTRGKNSHLPDLTIQYADYVYWQHEWLSGEVLEKQLSYWRGHLGQSVSLLNLPTDRPRPPVQTYRGAYLSRATPRTVLESLEALSRREGTTLFMTLLAAFKVLLHCYTGQTGIVVGTSIANRSRSGLEALIGFFVNTLALRTSLDGDPTFSEVLRRVRETSLEAYVHQELPFEKLVEVIQPERDMSYNPVFQVMFDLKSRPPLPGLRGVRATQFPVDPGASLFDMTMSVEPAEEGLLIDLEYNTDLFDASTVTRMLTHYENLLESVAADPSQRLSTWPASIKPDRARSSAATMRASKQEDLPPADIKTERDRRRSRLSERRERLSADQRALLEQQLRGEQ